MILKQLRESASDKGVSLNSQDKTISKPFSKAITEIRQISESEKLSPLEKLFEMQSLSIMDHFEQHASYYGDMILTRDEMISIMAYVIIHSGVPDAIS